MRIWMLAGLLPLVAGGWLEAADWPTFGRDARRSQTSAVTLDFAKLAPAWNWASVQPPLPAWGQPAKGDAFANLRDTGSMRNYDVVFHPIVVGDAMYFGSSVDDSLRCLDVTTGKLRWLFTAGGPIRIAPTFADGRIFLGADDGFVYCLAAKTGEQLWRYSASFENLPAEEAAAKVINNGRLISYWPCRTGVLVVGGTAYFGCSLLPWKPSLLCAVDVKTGKPEGEGRYAKELQGVTLEGPLVAGGDLMYAPQGREAPMQFQIADGKHLGTLKDGFGAFCVLTPDNRLLHGPKRKGGGIVDSNAQTRAPIATHKDARAMIVSKELSLMLTKKELAAADIAKRQMRWKVPIADAAAMILVDGAVVVGRRDRVTALDVITGEEIWNASIDGRAFGLAAAGGMLIASTDTGHIVCFRPGSEDVAKPAGGDEGELAVGANVKKPKPIEEFADEKLLGRWVFSPLAIQEDSDTVIANQTEGLPGTIAGAPAFGQHSGLDGLILDGKTTSVNVTADITKAKLPKKELTAEAWVRIDQPQEWGGIVGALQDNGSYERGWLMGFRKSSFNFAVAGKDASAKLTYLNAESNFQPGSWHHVAGTYDGATMRLYVDGKLSASSTEQRGEINYPPRAFYEIGSYRDDNEFYRTTGMLHEVRVYDRVLTADEIADHFAAKQIVQTQPAQLAAGPWIQFDSVTSAQVRLETREPQAVKLVLTDDFGREREFVSNRTTTEHTLHLDKLGRDRRYAFVVEIGTGDAAQATRAFEVDTYFNYHLADLPKPAADDRKAAKTAADLLAEYPRGRGLCLVIGSGDGRLAMEIAQRSKLRVIGLETDRGQVDQARDEAMKRGVYGPRCSFAHVPTLERLPVPSRSVNLMIVQADAEGELPTPLSEVERTLQPEHGYLLVTGEKADTLRSKFADTDLSLVESKSAFAARRTELPEAGDWSHMYGDASNAAYTGEALGGVKSTEDLSVSWLGLPGPRYQTDRQNRKSAPLYSGGRLYMQGQERVIALDGHNGSVLWSLELPGLLRFNIPRDASNWCCDENHLFLAHGDRCLQIDGETGEIVAQHRLPKTSDAETHDWGYVARSTGSTGDWILGTNVRKNSTFVDFWGGDYWFDQKDGKYTHQVCGESLFGYDKTGKRPSWEYNGGLIWNASLTANTDRIFFIESRGVELADDATSRLPTDLATKETWLVGLDLATGKKQFEQQIKLSPKVIVANMAYADDVLVLVTSVANKFPVRAYSAVDGKPLWDTTVGWPRNHHGGHLSRPAIVEGKVFVRPASLDLKTGKLLSNNMPGGGCGTYVATKDALFFRAGSGRQLSAWQPETGKYTHWARMRPDCWLSTIPAGGMLLSPEGGGGCSCGHWMEMSVGFVPNK